jgi:hypothetical protein
MSIFGFTILPPEITDVTAFLILGSLSALLVSMAKAGFGGSASLLSVPLMIMACGGQAYLATGITLPLLVVCDYVAVVSWWRKWSWRVVLELLPGSAIGLGLGWLTLWALLKLDVAGEVSYRHRADAAMMLCVGLIAVGFVILQAVRAWRSKPLVFRPVLWQSTAVGAMAGYTTTVAHAAGPVVTMYMLPQQMTRGRFVASTVLYYWIGNQVKLVPYFALGLLNPSSLGGALVLMPAVIAGTVLGLVLHRRVGEREFAAAVYVLLAVAGAKMLFDGIQILRG